MSISIHGRIIAHVPVLDDDPDYRATLQESIHELGVETVDASGPYPMLSECVAYLTSVGDAVVSDHRLRPGGYASFDGAELVAALYDAHVPSVLCTRWENVDINDIRRYRARIPVLLQPSELVSRLEWALSTCVRELEGDFLAERRSWRTLVRVTGCDSRFVTVVIPAWSADREVHIPRVDLPDWIWRGSSKVFRCHAYVNIGAEREEDLYVGSWSE